ncbi:NAD-dependent epimerase/dehydratase family protein [Anaerolineales bacterium HSG6]|nr:NAD-dependent epimerase/dehydratase family protein [Anaerolineales bacterium HSG6]
MKILITGSSGQVGTNLALRLLERNEQILGIDRRDNSWTDKIPVVKRDIAADEMPAIADLPPAFGQPDLVVHLAANAKVHELVENPRRAHENATTAFNVLEFCRLNQIPIIFSSSREVYGRPTPPTVAENTVNIYDILSPYAAYKMADEMLIYSYANCYDLKYLIFRLSNVYGRYDNDLERMTRVIHVFIDQMRRGEPITIFDRRKNIDFTHIDDCIQGIMLGIDNLMQGEVVNETINLSSGSPATLGYLAETIARYLDVTPEIIDKPIQPGEINFYIADLTKAKQLLGFEPQIPFEEGIKRTIEWSTEYANVRMANG